MGLTMCTLTQRELDFLASLRTGWRRLYRRELMRLVGHENASGAIDSEPRPAVWPVVAG